MGFVLNGRNLLSAFNFFYRFKDLLVSKTKQLAPDIDIEFQLASDGSGRGAALVAAVESRIHKLELK